MPLCSIRTLRAFAQCSGKNGLEIAAGRGMRPEASFGVSARSTHSNSRRCLLVLSPCLIDNLLHLAEKDHMRCRVDRAHDPHPSPAASTIATPTLTGPPPGTPPGRPVMLMRPHILWIIKSVPGAILVGAVLTGSGDRAVDQAAVHLANILVSESVFGQSADLVILEQEVRFGGQFPSRTLAPRDL